ncbi:hypothetical protein ACX80W_09595 [Arthrobacter sp. TMN-37]
MRSKTMRSFPAVVALSALALVGCDNPAEEPVTPPTGNITPVPTDSASPEESTIPTGTLPTSDGEMTDSPSPEESTIPTGTLPTED